MTETALHPVGGAVNPVAISLVDTDVHNISYTDALLPYLPQRWAERLRTFGVRTRAEADVTPALRPQAGRHDAVPPCGVAGGDPVFARRQHLDMFGVDIAILNNIPGQISHSGGNDPVVFSAALEAANNDWTMDQWFGSDPRWRGSVAIQYDNPAFAVAEIERCRALDDRWVQAVVGTRTERPFGHEKYWPLFEALTHYDMPLAFHPGGSGSGQLSGAGWPSYYFENHAGYQYPVVSQVSSMVFEGVFDRWPTLKVVVVEGGWSWVAPFVWRMESAMDVLGSEVSHLQRRPAEYLAEHFWFTTQPMEEPTRSEWFTGALDQFSRLGLVERLMFSSDYPHWDYDSPAEALPHDLPTDVRQSIMADTAAALYGFGRRAR
ncbi:amidohydrolase family protein [Pseudonocardia ailaonensis]|uniref:Amidohydrolase family protein n=1 Tax=Pseudonocardia ailaonensis TaxID=367279 RepID=A0ABN2N4U6_9PSEU